MTTKQQFTFQCIIECDEDALSIMEEYILPNSEIEDDNYQWLIINDLTVLP